MAIDTAAGPDREELRELLAETIDTDVADVQDTTDFIDALGVDSLMALEIVVVLERKYGVKFAEAEMREARTLDRIHDMLSQKLQEQQ